MLVHTASIAATEAARRSIIPGATANEVRLKAPRRAAALSGVVDATVALDPAEIVDDTDASDRQPHRAGHAAQRLRPVADLPGQGTSSSPSRCSARASPKTWRPRKSQRRRRTATATARRQGQRQEGQRRQRAMTIRRGDASSATSTTPLSQSHRDATSGPPTSTRCRGTSSSSRTSDCPA